MKIAVLNAHLPNYEPLARLTTWTNRALYCKRHGYDLRVKTGGWKYQACHPVSYDRLAYLVELLKSGFYDWVWVSGTDTFHTNFTIPLESFIDNDYHVIASPDWCVPIQADSFFVRASYEGIDWAEMILLSYEKYKNDPWVENRAMVDSYPDNKDIIKILPQRSLNAYNYALFVDMYPGEQKVQQGLDYFGNDGQWQPGDFLIHWPSLPLHVRIEQAKAYAKRIVT